MDASVGAAFLRDLVGWVLCTSAVDKALHFSSFVLTLQLRYSLGGTVARLVAPAVCGVELLIGSLLLLGLARPLAGTTAVALLLVLTCAGVFARKLEANRGCGCGGLAEFGVDRWTHVVVNALLVALVVLSGFIDPSPNSESTGAGAATGDHLVMIMVALLALASLLGARAVYALQNLSRQWREIEEWRTS